MDFVQFSKPHYFYSPTAETITVTLTTLSILIGFGRWGTVISWLNLSAACARKMDILHCYYSVSGIKMLTMHLILSLRAVNLSCIEKITHMKKRRAIIQCAYLLISALAQTFIHDRIKFDNEQREFLCSVCYRSLISAARSIYLFDHKIVYALLDNCLPNKSEMKRWFVLLYIYAILERTLVKTTLLRAENYRK